MKNLKEILKIGGILFAITAISAFLLAVVNSVTEPVIAKNQLEKTYKAMDKLMPAKSFSEIEAEGTEAYAAYGDDGEIIGVCIITSSFGYGGEVKVLTGVDKSMKVTGIDILSHSETPGLGANATKPDFKNQFSGKTSGISVAKKAPAENEIQAMSGATISSKAVTDAVNKALELAGGVLGEN